MAECKNGHPDPERNKAGACKECVDLYQPLYREEYKPRKHVLERERRERQRARAIEFLGGKCLDCGIADKRVLVFDHVRGEKVTNVARLLGSAWERIETELNKCDLVCANCHLVRTNERISKAKDTFVGRLERKTHCPQGHSWVENNIYTDKQGVRSCLACRRIRGRKYVRRKESRRISG